MTAHQTISVALFGACLAALLPSCRATESFFALDFLDLPESRIENLERLHTAKTTHRYSVHFVGDFEHSYGRDRRTIGGVTIGRPGGGAAAADRPTPVTNPSEKCLDLLSELLEFDSRDKPQLAALQVAWCARIISEDPSNLSRERATFGLGVFGRRLGIEGPVSLPLDAPRADANRTAELLTGLISTWRALREGRGSESELDKAVQAIRSTTFDLEGSRRVLPAVAGLLSGTKKDTPGRATLVSLIEDFQRRTIQFSLAHALNLRSGPASVVRAASVSAAVEAGGADMLARFMSVLQAERQAGVDRDGVLVFRVLELIATYGFPETFAKLEAERYARVREEWYGVLVGFAVEDLEGPVRVKAMQALERAAGGPGTLREEDWEDWYYARIDTRRAEDGLPPVLKASEVSEEPAIPAGEDS